MGQSLAIPRVIPNDWKRLDLIINKIKFNLGRDSSPTLTGLTLTGLTASRLIATDSTKALESVSNLASWVAGTTNQITVTDDSDGTITLSLPQDYHTGASPTLTGLTLSGLTQGSVVYTGASGVISQDNSNLFWDETNNRLGVGINSGFFPAAGATIVGEVDIIHTATESDDHAIEIDVDVDGKGDVKAIDIDYVTGAIVAGVDEGVILLNIDNTHASATGGEVFGLEVLSTEATAKIYGMKVGAVVGPIHQDSGTFANPAIGTNDTPQTAVANMIDGLVANTTAIFVAVDDYIIIGATAVFQELEFVLTTDSSGAGIKPKYEYSTGGSGFTEFFPVDGTNGFRNTGVIAWDASDLAGHAINADTGAANTYDIRITRQRNSLTTPPVLGYAKTAATTEYLWDKNGDVNINSLTLATVAAEGSDVDKFLVDSSGVVKFRTGAEVLSDIGGQASDAGLTSLAGLTYVSASFVKMTGANTFALRTLQETSDDLEATIDHDNLLNFASGEHFTQANITATGTITSGTWQGTTVAVNQGGTGQTTAQAAIDALSAVSGATNEHVLTKDTGTGNAIFKAAAGGGANHDILDGSVHQDSVADGVTRGSVIYGNSTPKWDELVIGANTKLLMSDGTDLAYKDIDDLTADGSPSGANDYVMTYDATAGVHKKVLLNNLPVSGAAFTSKCSVNRNAAQTINSVTWTKILLVDEDYDTDGEFDSVTNHRFQPAVNGYYTVHVGVGLGHGTDGVLIGGTIRKNNVKWKGASQTTGSTQTIDLVFSCDMYLLTTDYIELWIYHNVGVAKPTSTGRQCFMDVHRFA